MQKVLAISLFVGLMMQATPPLPGQAPGTSNKSSGKIQQQGQGDKSTPAPAVPIQKPLTSPNTDGNGAKIAPKDAQYSVKLTGSPMVTIADKNKTIFDYVFEWGPWAFSGLLVLVGIVGLILARRTLKTTDRQADLMQTQARLMERQTHLAEAQADQWVVLSNWRVKRPSADDLRVTVDLTNPTGFPITLNENSHITIGYFDREGYELHYIGGEGGLHVGDEAGKYFRHFLSPNVPTPIEIKIRITDAEQKGGVSFVVNARFLHAHRITKNEVVQNLAGRLGCAPWKSDKMWHATFTPYIHMNPEIQKPKDQDDGPKAI